jgi:hypothetical protein
LLLALACLGIPVLAAYVFQRQPGGWSAGVRGVVTAGVVVPLVVFQMWAAGLLLAYWILPCAR